MRNQHPGPGREGLNDVADNLYQLQLAGILAQVDRLSHCEQLNGAAPVGDEPAGRQVTDLADVPEITDRRAYLLQRRVFPQSDERAQRQYVLEGVRRSRGCRDLRREQRPGPRTAPVTELANRGPESAAAILVAYATSPPFLRLCLSRIARHGMRSAA
jgi:hypothetical protein